MTLPESSDELLRQGIAALRAGDRTLATNLLARAVRADPRSEQAWLYLAGAVSDPEQRRTCLERVLSLNPQNAAALQGLRGMPPAVISPSAPTAAGMPRPVPTPAPPPPAPAPAPAPTPAPPAPPADRVMSLLAPEPGPPPQPPAQIQALPPEEPATSTTMRLSPAFVTVELDQPAASQRRPGDRLVWVLVLALGIMLMLGSIIYTIMLLRG
jgi:hypothetical protein